jgi:exopolyphosphatase
MSSRAAPETPPPRRREDGSDRSSSSSSPPDPTRTENRLLEYLSNVKSQFVAEKEASSLASTTSTTTSTTSATTTAAAAVSLHAGGDRDKLLHQPVHFVIGNEAGDADSVVSALAHAYLLHCIGVTAAAADDTSSDLEPPRAGGVVVVVPVVSIPIRDVLTQRPETLFLLQTLAGLTKLDETLCDIDELVEFVSIHAGRRHPITLVDHNQISSRLQPPYATNDPTILEVVGIVDHHRDVGFHADTCSDVPLARNVAFDESTGHPLVASTCTLVVEELLRIRTGGGTPHLDLPPQVSVLLLGTILLDSINLDPRAGKVTDRDTAAVNELLRCTRWDGLGSEAKRALGMSGSNVQPDCSSLFQLLQAAKFDPEFWGSLSVRDALRLDYKQFSTGDAASNSNSAMWGMSTVLLDFDSFSSKADWERTIRSFMIERNLDLLVVMLSTSSVAGGDDITDDRPATMKRQLVLCDLRMGSIVNDLVGHLSGPQVHRELKLVEMLDETRALSKGTSSVYIRAFHQGNAKASRKQVAPILFDYF